MMTVQELKFVLSEGEGLFIEFKERVDKSLAREITAFANASGGRILIGVADDACIFGVRVDNRVRSQVQDIARNCDPPVPIRLSCVGSVLTVEVPESVNKPHACSDGFFMRIGANSQKLSRDEVFSMGIRSGRLRFDEQICDAFDCLSDVDDEKVSAYLKTAGLEAILPPAEVLVNLEIIEASNGRYSMKNAGVLLFAKDPLNFLKSASIVCAVYQGDDKAEILDRKIYNDGLLGNIEAALTYLKRHIDVRFEINSLVRREVPQYPEAAVREAVVNALMHRDYYDASGDVMVEVFRSHITVSNPGGLVSWLRREDFGKYSRTRNRLLASMLMRTPYVERMGTGILRINRALEEAGLPQAEFSFDEFSFSITFHSGKQVTGEVTGEVSGEVTGEVLRLLRVMAGEMKRLEIQKRLSLKHEDYFREKYLIPSLDAGLIEMTIPDKPRSSKQKYRLTEHGKLLKTEGISSH